MGMLSFPSSSENSFTVSWVPPSEGGAPTGYRVLHRKSDADWPADSAAAVVGVVTETTIGSLTAGGTYEVKVRACNGDNQCGEWSDVGSVTLPTTPPVITAPGQVRGVTAVSDAVGRLTVSWDTPSDGGGGISGYKVRHKLTTEAEWTSGALLVGGGLNERPITGLTDGPTHHVQVQACSGTPGVGCGAWSNQVVGVLRPTGLDVTPLPGRKARLTWGRVPSVADYIVEVRKHGVSGWPRPSSVGDPANPNIRSTNTTSLEIDLDGVLQKIDPGNPSKTIADKGLAHAPAAYEIRVKGAIGSYNHKEYSDEIVIIDTPITVANGKSLEPQKESDLGQAELIWTSIDSESIMNSTDYAGGSYQLRYRKSVGDHTDRDTWTLSHFEDRQDLIENVSSPHTINGLERHAIYAIQVVYRDDPNNSNDTDVFAARYVYVWPSYTAAKSGDVVATYPLYNPVANGTFLYRICEDTFPTDKKNDWRKLINHSLGQWEEYTRLTPTKTLVNMTHEIYTQEEVDEDPTLPLGASKPCATYGPFIQEVVTRIGMASDLTPKMLIEYAEEIVKTLKLTQLFIPELNGTLDLTQVEGIDAARNEILMDDDKTGNTAYLRKVRGVALFPHIADDLGYEWCWEDNDVLACAVYSTNSVGHTTDIILLRSKFENDPLSIPGSDTTVDREDVVFNTCLSTGNSAYRALIHEAGHALGIRFGGLVADQAKSHPHRDISDSLYLQSASCSPHPLDLMVIYALYQHLP